MRSWLDSRNFLPGLRTTARRPYKQEVAGSSPAAPTRLVESGGIDALRSDRQLGQAEACLAHVPDSRVLRR